jgi:putative FmdB family regulatory protein
VPARHIDISGIADYSKVTQRAKEDENLPIYEYQCTACGKIFEVFQSFKDEPIKKCTYCSGKVTKLISNCSFQLKGTGWYITDYGRKDSGASGANDKKKAEKTTEATATETPVTTKEKTKKPQKTDE